MILLLFYFILIIRSGQDGTVRIWSLPSRMHHFLRQTCVFNRGDTPLEECDNQLLSLVTWNSNGKLLAGAMDNMVNIWLIAGV